ncbi:hypothetical protein KKG29_02335 [Patescibacteria group bacterium]|nr:hypothetical protein [Patescibacteria group bacterium]
MNKEEPKIKIPDPLEEFSKRFDRLFYLVIGAMLIGFISLLFMVAGIVIETWRFNSSVYKESQQLNIQEENIKNTVEQQKLMIEELKKINKELNEIKSKK